MKSINYKNQSFIFNDGKGETSFLNEQDFLEKCLNHYETRSYYLKDPGFFIFRTEDLNVKSECFSNFKEDFPYFIEDEILNKLCDYVFENYRRYCWNFNFRNRQAALNRIKFCFMMLYKEYPQIEFLSKIEGFEKFLTGWVLEPENPKYFRSFKKASNINDITTMPKWMWKRLLDENADIDTWNSFRIWNSQIKTESKKTLEEVNKKRKNEGLKLLNPEGMTKETLDLILDLNLDSRTLEKVRKIIRTAVDDEGKSLLTVEKLIKFLERVDMYQAIRPFEAVDILIDYIRMCRQLGTEPRLDSDSLKREHDVTARNYSIWQREKRELLEKEKSSRFIQRAVALSKYEYSNEKLTAIVPKTVSDLINEGYHNHNCVGSYVDVFASEKSNIFFIRKASDLTKSYITIELNKNCTDYRQAFYAGNQRITRKEDLSFIKEWLENNKKINGLVV